MYIVLQKYYIGSAKYLFFGKCLKKTTEYFLKYIFFYLKVQFFRLIMENNFIQMAASAGQIIVYTIGPIFKHIIGCVQLCFTNGNGVKSSNGVKSQLRGSFGCVPRSVVLWNQMVPISFNILQFLWTKIRSTWPNNDRHWL